MVVLFYCISSAVIDCGKLIVNVSGLLNKLGLGLVFELDEGLWLLLG